jgi:thiosulfate dehydrogenase
MPISRGALCGMFGAAALTVCAIVRPMARADGADTLQNSSSSSRPSLPSDSSGTSATAWTIPNIDSLPDDDWGRTVRYGRDLISQTASLIGPEIADTTHRFAGNNLNCESCHVDAGTKQFGLPFQGVYADFPNYRARSGNVGTLEDRIQGCMTRSMNGKPLPAGGREITAMVAYIKFLSTGHPVGAATLGRGPGKMQELSRPADPIRGQILFTATCAACHGENGEGQRVGSVGDAQGYAVPALWGDDSFNDGAGMGRLINAANFIHNNMPHGITWQQPALSVEDAWDVAAYIEAKPRSHKAQLDHDYPNRLQKPVDAPYGPYADKFDPQQHKFGPFTAIREAVEQLKAEQTKPASSPASTAH